MGDVVDHPIVGELHVRMAGGADRGIALVVTDVTAARAADRHTRQVLDTFVEVVETGQPFVDDAGAYEDVTANGTPIAGWWHLQVVPFADGYLAAPCDITVEVTLREEARLAAERSQRDRIAVDLLPQATLPTALPAVPDLARAARHLPATTDSPVGGDWYDASETSDGRVALVVGDVAGHGTGSTVRMLQARALVRTAAGQMQPGAILTETNRMLTGLWQAQTLATRSSHVDAAELCRRVVEPTMTDERADDSCILVAQRRALEVTTP